MRFPQCVAASLLALAAVASGLAQNSSPVADAAMNRDKAAVRSLIQKKANVNAQQADGSTALQWAAYYNDAEMADLLIAAGANPKLANNDGATPLMLASINGNAAIIAKLLKAGADPNERQPKGETPLMFASRNGNLDSIKVLLDHGADINARETVRGTTALMWACEQVHPAAVKLLIERGADVKAISKFDSKGGTAYLAPSIAARKAQDQGAGGLRAQLRARALRNAAQNPPQISEKNPPHEAPGVPGGTPQAVPVKPTDKPGDKEADKKDAEDEVAAADAQAAAFAFGRTQNTDGGGLTPLIFAARENCLECAKMLIEAGADVNQKSHYGWTPLLTATQNRHYKLGAYLLDHGADPNIPNNGGWRPLYLATDNRNIEGGDYPVRPADMDHLEFIKLLLDHGADVNARICGAKSTAQQCVGDSTETRTIFTMQWLYEDGATPFLRAAQSSDVELMKLLLAHGADPKIPTAHNVTALAVAAGIGWVDGVTYEWSQKENLEAVKMCLDLGIDPNIPDSDGRTALHGAAHKGRLEVIQMLVDHGAKLDAHDLGSRDTINGAMLGHTWIPYDYAQGLVRVGVQSAIPHPEAAELLKKLMVARGIPVPPPIKSSICLTTLCKGDSE